MADTPSTSRTNSRTARNASRRAAAARGRRGGRRCPTRRIAEHSDRDEEFLRFAEAVENELLAAARAWCHDRGRAEQFVQETSERLLRAWPRLDAAGNRAAFARRTLVNLMISEHRRPASRREVSVDSAAGFDFADRYPALLDRDTIGELDLLRVAGDLPVEQQQVVIARYWADLTVPATAALLGVSERTVEARTQAALAALRDVLSQREVDR